MRLRRRTPTACCISACLPLVVLCSGADAITPPEDLQSQSWEAQMDFYSNIRGFNYQPSYEANGYAIWRNFKPSIIERELALGKNYFPKMNAVRLWLSWDAFLVGPDEFAAHFERALQICDRQRLKVVPTLYNNWHTIPDFGGISEEMLRWFFINLGKHGEAPDYAFLPYMRRIVGEHREDPRILVWDLCNEPFNNGDKNLLQDWLTHTYQLCKRLGATHPIGVSVQIRPEYLERVVKISDVLLIHPYGARDKELGEVISYAREHGKPLLATECCWGSLDDETRAKTVAEELAALARHRIGFFPHALHESLVADLHHPQYGPISAAGYMAFINFDGTLRKGHDVYNDF